MREDLLRILKWWVTPKLPPHYYSSGFKGWIFHPIKRRIAKLYIWFLQNILRVKVIGITGSVGKTTAKEMIYSVLSQKYSTVSSFANIDPVYNIPTTILKTPLTARVLVIEMGVEYPGDMDFYNWLVRPDIGVLLNIYWTHTEFLGKIEGVKKEKAKLIENLANSGYAILNLDDSRVASLAKTTKAKVLTFGTAGRVDIKATNINITEDLKTKFTLTINQETEKIELPILGKHFVYPALAAATAGYVQNIPFHLIKRGIESFRSAPHRMVPIVTKSGALILDDTYNSNPLGVKAAVDVLLEIGKGKKKVAVLGDMLELGEYTEEGHEEVGEYAAKNGVDTLVCIGDYAKHFADGASRGGMKKSNIVVFSDKNSPFQLIESLAIRNSVILFKSSRKLKLEELVEKLVQ